MLVKMGELFLSKDAKASSSLPLLGSSGANPNPPTSLSLRQRLTLQTIGANKKVTFRHIGTEMERCLQLDFALPSSPPGQNSCCCLDSYYYLALLDLHGRTV